MKKLTTLSAASLIKVQFFHSKDGGATEFYFGSLAAIYEMFDASDISRNEFSCPPQGRRKRRV